MAKYRKKPVRARRVKPQREIAEARQTIALLAQQLADKREIIRRLTT